MGGRCASKRMSTTLPRTETIAPWLDEMGLLSIVTRRISRLRSGWTLRVAVRSLNSLSAVAPTVFDGELCHLRKQALPFARGRYRCTRANAEPTEETRPRQ